MRPAKGRTRILAKRAAISLLAFDLACVFLYLIGNSQDFLDATQFMLLGLVGVSSALLAVISVAGVLASVSDAGKAAGRLAGILGYAALGAGSLALLALSKAILVIAGGLR
ncbi:MAG: hypothetical protein NT080_12295 [Spirochaetes bacterium]|nr:hypothetical protein [Spirochaetota bacterium]